MKVRIFLSEDDRFRPRVAFVSPDSPESVLPPDTRWQYARCGDTSDFSLPTAIDDEIRRCGFWVHVFGSGAPVRERPPRATLEPSFG